MTLSSLYLWTGLVPPTPLLLMSGGALSLVSALFIMACLVALWLVRDHAVETPTPVHFHGDEYHRAAA